MVVLCSRRPLNSGTILVFFDNHDSHPLHRALATRQPSGGSYLHLGITKLLTKHYVLRTNTLRESMLRALIKVHSRASAFQHTMELQAKVATTTPQSKT